MIYSSFRSIFDASLGKDSFLNVFDKVPVFEREARVKCSYSSGYIESVYIESVYIESEKAIRDGVSRFLSTSDNEVSVEVRDIIEILALRARTPRTDGCNIFSTACVRFEVTDHFLPYKETFDFFRKLHDNTSFVSL